MIPDELKFTKSHEWLRLEDDFTAAVGITEHLQDRLGDIVFVELPGVNLEMAREETAAVVESSTDLAHVLAPVSGLIVAVNRELEDTPNFINTDPYGDGWIFKIEIKHPGEIEDLMDADAYSDYLDFGPG